LYQIAWKENLQIPKESADPASLVLSQKAQDRRVASSVHQEHFLIYQRHPNA
jgi:hypothetical protein